MNHSVKWADYLAGIDAVIHLAGVAHRSAPDDEMMRLNKQVAIELAEAATKADVKHFIFVSSIAAQTGPSASSVLTETDPPRGLNAYGRSKLEAETALSKLELPLTILRPVAVYGPNAKGNFAALKKLAGLPLPLPFGAINAKRSILSIENLNAAVACVLGNAKAVSETFIVADPDPKSISDMLSDIRAAHGRSPRLFNVPTILLEPVLRATGVWDKIGRPLVVNPQKLMALGWQPKAGPVVV
jgi:UDP-glucose 4-epimerase